MRPAGVLPQLIYIVVLFSTYVCITHTIQCYCDKTVGLPDVPCVLNSFTCTSNRGCYLRRMYNSPDMIVVVQVWGCISDDHGVHDQINYTSLFCGPWNTPVDAYKCCFTDLCNKGLRITLESENVTESETVTPLPSVAYTQPHSVNAGLVSAITVTIAVTVLIILGLLLCVLTLIRRRYARSRQVMHYPTTGSAHRHWIHNLELVELSASGRSTDLPYQVLSDIKDIVKLNYQIEIGRFGTFYHGFYEGVEVALKQFEEGNWSAWLQESVMYNSVLQTHENILACFASAMTNCDSGRQFWLATKYHELGSLQDFLRQHTVTPKVILHMMASICSGLSHLHSDSSYNQVKIPVAHCNLTSRNILVKGNLSCCIGDFRLAVFKHKNEVHQAEDAKLGTVRYMAPEMLSDSFNSQSFESFKQVDVYALGLVLWEVCQRSSCYGVLPEAYQVPFQGLVPPDPSLEDMRRVVVSERQQPTIPNKWNYSKLLSEITKVMRECWYYTSTARPTAVYLKKKLLKMSHEFENINFADQPMMPSKDDCKDVQCGKLYVSSL